MKKPTQKLTGQPLKTNHTIQASDATRYDQKREKDDGFRTVNG